MPSLQTAPIVQIVEVLGPAEQGISRPFRCRGDDGHIYYVKGHQTNRASLWAEWICAHLARALELPLPPFGLVKIDETLLCELPREWRALGAAHRVPSYCLDVKPLNYGGRYEKIGLPLRRGSIHAVHRNG